MTLISIVIRIRQKRSPEIVNILQSRKGSKLPQKAQRRVNAGFWRKVLCSCQHGHPFHVKGKWRGKLQNAARESFQTRAKLAPLRERAAATITLVSKTIRTNPPHKIYSALSSSNSSRDWNL